MTQPDLEKLARECVETMPAIYVTEQIMHVVHYLERAVESLRAELEESNKLVSAWKTEAELMLHKVITCGIVAEGNEHLHPIYQRDGKWDSRQADKVRELRAQLAAKNEILKASWGHEAACYYCGKPCSCIAANPSEWPIPLCHSDEPGKVKAHHIGCVVARTRPEAVTGWNTRATQPENSKEQGHAGDCTIYRALINGNPTDGICTCGYGWSLVRESDWSQMYSKELIRRDAFGLANESEAKK